MGRFWSKVDKSEIHNGCWVWTGGKDQDGYGNFHFQGRLFKAHRISWMLCFGDIPNGLLICHHCDNPSCVNPIHLFIGTMQDNMNDSVSKGRKFTQTHCKRGHLYSESLELKPDGKRCCKFCRQERDRVRKHNEWFAKKDMRLQNGM